MARAKATRSTLDSIVTINFVQGIWRVAEAPRVADVAQAFRPVRQGGSLAPEPHSRLWDCEAPQQLRHRVRDFRMFPREIENGAEVAEFVPRVLTDSVQLDSVDWPALE